jgi:hypothetical protein
MHPQILVGTSDGLYEVSDHRLVQFSGHAVNALARSNGGWWAIINRREVWRPDATGAWRKVATVESLRANCLLPTATGLLIGTSDAHLLALRGETLEPIRPFETVEGRQEWHNPDGSPADVRSMAIEPHGTVYVNVHVGGVVRSTDEGQSWTPTIDVNADVHEVVYDQGAGLVLAATARGLATSDDRGESWRFDTTGLHGRYLRAVAVSGPTVLVTASTGPFSRQAAVYRKSETNHEAFERCQQGLPEWFSDNINTSCLKASGPWVVFGTATGEVFLSADEGQRWSVAAAGLPPVRCVAVA